MGTLRPKYAVLYGYMEPSGPLRCVHGIETVQVRCTTLIHPYDRALMVPLKATL